MENNLDRPLRGLLRQLDTLRLQSGMQMSEYARLSLRGIALIPQNLKCTKKIGVSEKIADFVIPFGGVMSMNGTAIYEVVGALPGHP